jgi:hypothetical protein
MLQLLIIIELEEELTLQALIQMMADMVLVKILQKFYQINLPAILQEQLVLT